MHPLKVFIVLFVVLISAGCTSVEMQTLRNIEASLDLPKPRYRSEKDKGYYKDGKGARHYDRRIHIDYRDIEIEKMSKIKATVQEKGWMLKTTSEYNELITYHYTNESNAEIILMAKGGGSLVIMISHRPPK